VYCARSAACRLHSKWRGQCSQQDLQLGGISGGD
jgi:hypothetical protein